MQDRVARLVGKVDAEEAHVARERCVGDGAVGLVRVLPRPLAGPVPVAALALAHGTVLVDGAGHELDVALVLLGLLVDELEDALGAREAHDHGVHLVGYLADLVGELLGHVEERHAHGDGERQPRDGGVGDAEHQEDADGHGDDHVEQVAGVHEDGHERVGVGVGRAGGVLVLVVELVEGTLDLALVREHLDDLLAVHDLLDEALHGRHGALRAQEVPRRAARERLAEKRHDDRAAHHDERERQAVPEHDAADGAEHEHREEELGERLGDHLTHGVDVVGVVAHHVTVLVRVEVPDRQVLHVVEHEAAELLERPLGDDGHALLPQGVADEARKVERSEDRCVGEDLRLRRGPVAGLPGLPNDGERALHEDVRHRLDDALDEDAARDGRQHDWVEAAQHLEDPEGGPAHRLGRPPAVHVPTHRRSPPARRARARRGSACSARGRPRGRWRFGAGAPRGSRCR